MQIDAHILGDLDRGTQRADHILEKFSTRTVWESRVAQRIPGNYQQLVSKFDFLFMREHFVHLGAVEWCRTAPSKIMKID